MVLLVPDDMPAGATTLAGNVDEMRALYKDWDPRRASPIPTIVLCHRLQKSDKQHIVSKKLTR